MELRRIWPNEFEAYRDVRLRALRLAPDAFGATFEEASRRTDDEWRAFTERIATAEGNAGFVVNRGNGAFAGLATVRFGEDSDVAPGTAEVNQMWVDEDLRGGPWAAALLEACEAYAADRGVEHVVLWVAEANERAARLYARCGYEPTGATEPLRGGLELELAKPLASPPEARRERAPRTPGGWEGRVKIAEDFDVLPPELAERFGIERT